MSVSTSLLSLDEGRVIAAKCLDSSNIKVISIKEKTLGNETGGFMSDYVIFEIRVRISDGIEETISLFSKTLPNSPQFRKYVQEVNAHEKELGFYRKLLPLLQKYQKQIKCVDDNRVKGKWGPQCFLMRDDIIVMENLSALGYEVRDYRALYDFNHCILILEKMASFHAATIIFEEKERKETGKVCRIGDMCPECFVSVIDRTMPGNEHLGWFPAGIRAMKSLVPYLSKYKNRKDLHEKIREKLPDALKQFSVLARSSTFRNVVCHGDLWASNILFHDGKNKRPEAVRFVDYQILRFAPPATDIAVFFYTSTDREFRERHVSDLLEVYYKKFASELQENGLCADELLSFDELKKSYEYYKAAGRATAAMYFEMTLLSTERKKYLFSSHERYSVFFSIERFADILESFQNDSIYRDRVEASMNELIELDILNES